MCLFSHGGRRMLILLLRVCVCVFKMMRWLFTCYHRLLLLLRGVDIFLQLHQSKIYVM